jgi:hypothetical protein
MTNIKATVNGDVLTMTVLLTERHGRSKSGKTEMIASTNGNVSVPGHEDIKMGINIYTK